MARAKPKFVVDENGKKTAVILEIASYRALLEHIAQLEDALELDEAIRSSKGSRPYDEIRAELKHSGRL